MKKLFGLIFVLLLISCAEKNEKKYFYTPFIMDTVFEITLYHSDENEANDIARECESLIRDLENRYSATLPSSLIYQLNETGTLELDRESKQVLSNTVAYAQWTKGTFDPSIYPLIKLWGFPDDNYRVPDQNEINTALESVGYEKIILEETEASLSPGTQIDLGGIMKGYAVDRAVAFLKSRGVKAGLVNAGGNLRTFGDKPDGEPWGIAVRHPRNLSEYYLVLTHKGDIAYATSGDYERYFEEDGIRYHHILSPEDGYPVKNGVISVTVRTGSAETCDALSTAFFVMGEEKALSFAENNRIGVFIIMESNDILYNAESSYWDR